VPGLPVTVTGSPFAGADAVVLASYGVGTANAATVVLLATKAEVPGASRLAPDLLALGPDDWIGQLETRAAIDAKTPLRAPEELLALRDHAMPKGATGAVIRVTARLPFDARVSISNDAALAVTPARLSLWGDIADDLAIVIDADASDQGGSKDDAKRLGHALRGALRLIANDPMVRALGVPSSIADARMIQQGNWIRAIIAIGPDHLARAVERANEMLQGDAREAGG